VLRSGYRRRLLLRRTHRESILIRAWGCKQNPFSAKVAGSPTPAILWLGTPYSHLRDRVSPRLVLSGCTLHPPATRLRPTRRYSPPIPASVLWLRTLSTQNGGGSTLGFIQRRTIKRPPPYVGGLWGGASAPTAPPQLPLYMGELKLPPHIG